MKDEGRGGGSELGSDLDPDPWKILWIRIRQNDVDPFNPDPQHCLQQEHQKLQRSLHATSPEPEATAFKATILAVQAQGYKKIKINSTNRTHSNSTFSTAVLPVGILYFLFSVYKKIKTQS